MPDIKTKDSVKRTIRTINKSVVAGERMKAAYIAARKKGEESIASDENSVDEYVSEKYEEGVSHTAQEAVNQMDTQARRGIKAIREGVRKAKNKTLNIEGEPPENYAEYQTERPSGKHVLNRVYDNKTVSGTEHIYESEISTASNDYNQRSYEFYKGKTIKNIRGKRIKGAERTVAGSGRHDVREQSVQLAKKNIYSRKTYEKYTEKYAEPSIHPAEGKIVKTTGRMSIRTGGKSIRTPEYTERIHIKTPQQMMMYNHENAYRNVESAKKAARYARAAAKAAARAAKAAQQAAAAAIKAIIAGIKALIIAIAAGGWIVIVVIIVICLAALLMSSVLGIFFSGEDSGTGQTIRSAIADINKEYDDRISDIKDSVSYDFLEMSGSRPPWKEILAVYAVKTAADEDNPLEVATMDDEKLEILKGVFWDMNEITYRVETVTSSDPDGENESDTTYLYINISHKTVGEMADLYEFSDEQREYMDMLLDEKNNQLWTMLLYGVASSDMQIVEVARDQIGNVGGEPYWSWYGWSYRVEWCACFVSWCANECGYIESGLVPKFSSCGLGVKWFREHGKWIDGGEIPMPGMIIFFDWSGDGWSNHVGIVERVENGRVYTIEGNSGDACCQQDYSLDYECILGYGVVQEKDREGKECVKNAMVLVF